MTLLVPFLAAYRLVRAWLWEEIGEKPRQRAEAWLSKPVVDGEGVVDEKATYRKGWFYKLITCPYCLGFWLTWGCVIGQRIPFVRRGVDALASATLLCVALDHYPDKGKEAAEEYDENEPPDPETPVTEQWADVVDNVSAARREREVAETQADL